MEKARKIMRRSIFTLLKDFHYFTNYPLILLLPFSISILVCQSFFVSSITFIDFNLYKLIFTPVCLLPLALFSLLTSKSFIIQYFYDQNHQKKPTVSSLYKSLALTYFCNTLLTVIINISISILLRVASSVFEELFGFSWKNSVFILASRVVFYTILINITIISNLSLVMAGLDRNCNGYKATEKAFLLRKCTKSKALSLALPMNLGLAAIQFLFKYRIVRAYNLFGKINFSLVFEGLLIAYMFSIVIALDTIVCCLFVKSCDYQIELAKEGSCSSISDRFDGIP